MDKCAIICAIVVVLILCIILCKPKTSGSEYFTHLKDAKHHKHAQNVHAEHFASGKTADCPTCKATASLYRNAEHLRDVGACSNLCDRRPGSQQCNICMSNQPGGGSQNLRGAVLGLLE
jgi:hypothetical protein